MKRYVCFIGPAFLAAAVLLFILLFKTDSPPSAAQKDYRVMAILNPEGNLFWKTVWQGLRDGAGDSSFALSEYEFSDIAEENRLLDIALRTKADGILLHPKASLNDEFYEKLSSARAMGIKIVVLDADISVPDYDAFVGIDNTEIGAAVAEYISERFEENQAILVLRNDSTLSNTMQDRLDGFYASARENGLAPAITVLETSPDSSQGITELQNVLLSTDGTVYLVAFGPNTTLKAAGVVALSDLSGRVHLVGFGETEEALQYVKSGVIQALFVQDNYHMGKASAEIMERLLQNSGTLPFINQKINITLVTPENVAERQGEYYVYPSAG